MVDFWRDWKVKSPAGDSLRSAASNLTTSIFMGVYSNKKSLFSQFPRRQKNKQNITRKCIFSPKFLILPSFPGKKSLSPPHPYDISGHHHLMRELSSKVIYLIIVDVNINN